MTKGRDYDISEFYSDISDCSSLHSDISENGFFQKAFLSVIRCTSLNDCLVSLFNFLRTVLPVTYIFYTPPYESKSSQHIYVSFEGIQVLANTKNLSGLQMHKVLEHRKRFGQNKTFYIGEDDRLNAFFEVIADDIKIASPCLYFYFMSEGHIQGSMYFGCSKNKPFSERDLHLLNMLWEPLFGIVRLHHQQERLEKLLSMTREANKVLRKEKSGVADIVGANSGLKSVVREIRLLAPFDVPVLLEGETGTGKDVFASELHRLSPRSGRNFVPVNCGGIAPSLIDSELFGYTKGAFTGAFKDYKGRFERANGGTLFLDEIGELPLDAQTRLLRVIQNRMVERLGGSESIPVDFRLVCATNKDLAAMVRKGTFREDLYFRLAGVTVQIPPLRERPGDIPLLIQHVLDKESVRNGIIAPALAEGEMQKMLNYAWPGNVRELINVVTEGFVRSLPDGPIVFRIGRNRNEQEGMSACIPSYADAQRAYFDALLKKTSGRISGPNGAAELAGLKPNTLRSKLDKLNIPYGRKTDDAEGR